MKYVAEVETLYRGTVFFESATTEVEDKVIDYAHSIKDNDLHITSTAGGPAWGPYVVIDGHKKDSVDKAVKKLESYIKRFK